MKHAKRIGALVCVLAICFTFATAPAAHASGLLSGQQFGAWIAAGLMSLQIIAGQAYAIQQGEVFFTPEYKTYMSDPLPPNGTEFSYRTPLETISDYLNAATIKVDQGVTTIDGVVYDELWVSPGTFTSSLKTNLFDFKTKWAILSGQAGTIAEGAGHINGIPMYNFRNSWRGYYYATQMIESGYGSSFGLDGGSVVSGVATNYKWIDFVESNGNRLVSGALSKDSNSFITGFVLDSSNRACWGYGTDLNTTAFTTFRLTAPVVDYDDFNFKYVSGIVPSSESDIPDNYGLSIQIPHDQLQTFYNLYPQYNVDNSVINIQQDQVDIDQLTQAIFDQITSMDDIKGQWKAAEEPVPPEPEPPGPAEDVLTGVNTIIGQQNTQISQNQQDLQIQQQLLQQQQLQLQQQQQISENTSDIKDAIEKTTEVPTGEQLPDFKFDLRELFPFCIPFDIYRLLSSFDAEPVAPHVQLPIVIQSIGFSYNLDLDFSAWNPVAQAMRTAELIVYAIGLAWATGKVIKW